MLRSVFSAVLACALVGASIGYGQERLPKLDILRKGCPGAFFFRSTEGFARSGKMPFEEWDETFDRLNGIMGKALDEEVPGTSPNCVPFFTRFKSLHPAQVVLLHYNGNSRDPRYQAEAFFAGHWIYSSGCRLTKDLPAEEGESVVHVEDPTLFRTNMGRYGDKNDDIGICALGEDGKPNWRMAEQVELLEVNREERTIKVKRGAFGTKPLGFEAGKAYVAPHMTEGPWGKRSNLLWYYNYSTACPKDSQTRTCTDVLVEDLARRFLPGGELSAFDGLEFDVLHFGNMAAPPGGKGMDANADGAADWGIIDGINVYGIGIYDFCRKLRERMGDDFIIQADGASPGSQRSFGLLNGIESEGWPTLSDHKADDWSGGLNRHFYWRDHARKPVFNYVNHKYVEAVPGKKGQIRHVDTPFSLTRLVFAACMFTDSMITYSLPCPGEPEEKFGVYDELRMGMENRPNWLGMPVAPPVRLALKSPDLLNGRGVKPDQAFLDRWHADDATIAVSEGGNALGVSGKDAATRAMHWKLSGIEIPKGDLFVHFHVKADPMQGYPEEIPRCLWGEARSESEIMDQQPERTGMTLRRKTDGEIDEATRAVVGRLGKAEIEGKERYGYFVHPPWYGGVAGSVFWEADALVPTDGVLLRFHTGLRKAPSKSDGITFKVIVRGEGEPREVFSYHHSEFTWKEHSVDLSEWKGKKVALRFIADCGPKDNCTADHGCWAEVGFARQGETWKPFRPARYMAWAGRHGDDVGFYFRDVDWTRVDLRFEIEGTEPVSISGLTVHSHADAIIREYENGVVLANPSDHEYAFDVKELFPKKALRRLKGSSKQDPAANNGQPAGDRITLGPRDAIFLVSR